MIHIECSILDLKTRKFAARYMKSFDIQDEFNKWYANMKPDPSFVMNIMYYNPEENAGQKITYDAILVRTNRNLPV